MPTITTLFSGGEGISVGARAAGITHLNGFEYDDQIAQVARDNGFDVTTANVLDIDPTTLQVPDILHFSPVCTRASVANQSAELNEDGTKEAPLDIDFGLKIAHFIDVMQPRIVTLENVYQYRNFKAFKIICAALDRNGYFWDYDNLNAADYGVPQTRRRLILRAMRGSLLPMLPQPVHWIGWYEAIEDLIHTLPDSKFADWQLARLPEEIKGNLMSVINGEASDYLLACEPAQTIAANHSVNKYRAFILAQGKYGNDLVKSNDSQPVFTITANSNQSGLKAFILDGKPANYAGDLQITTSDNPVVTITASQEKHPFRAWLLDMQNTGRDMTALLDSEPSFTVQAGTMRRPSSTPKAWLSQGRVVSMTYQALARFQSFPDSYKWTDNKRLNCKIIGNSVPPLLYQRIIEPLVALL